MDLFYALRAKKGDIVALVGGGGKTSAMFRLGDELAKQSWRVVLTTSTHIGAEQVTLAPHAVIRPTDQLAERRLTCWPTLLTGEINRQTRKATGLEPDVIDRIPSALGADIVINEADGARKRPFKAPADHEPVVTPGTTLVVPVVGIDAVGQPLDAAHVHRPERVAWLTGAQLGEPVTPEIIAAVLTHPLGGLRKTPRNARVVVLVNKVHTKDEAMTANYLAKLLLTSPSIEAVVIGAIQEANPIQWVRSRVAVVVLAAGASQRFGQLKQLLPWKDGTLLTHATDVALASGGRPVVVVLGCQADACRAVLRDRPVQIVVNPDWEQGQSTSIRTGLAALSQNVGGALFHLADLPGVTPEVIDTLVARHRVTLAPVIYPEYNGHRGNPVLFDRAVFPELREVKGDVGGKLVLMRYARRGQIERVAVDEPGVLMDIDSPDDLF